MAVDTRKTLRSDVIYSVFIRNYSQEGTFLAVEKDLDRIQSLGVDIIWLMPIHPSGKVHRKGNLGSPYAISDYRAINPEYGTLEDFERLVKAIHARGMRCIIDVVYNHTSPDSAISKEHPEWFFHKADGSFGNKVGDWWDVIDLDYDPHTNPDWEGLWNYQIDTLKYWAQYVDGFRCDVAPMVPIAFWERARAAVAESVGNDREMIWLAESVEPDFIAVNRSLSIPCSSDAEIFRAFDLSYEYDVNDHMMAAAKGQEGPERYLELLNQQETMYPDNYDKCRFMENHDRERAHSLVADENALRSWTAFTYFRKGTTLIYAGEENGVSHTPSLFDKDDVDWSTTIPSYVDLTPLKQTLYRMKHGDRSAGILQNGTFHAKELEPGVMGAVHTANADKMAGTVGAQGKLVGLLPIDGAAHTVSFDEPKEAPFETHNIIIPNGGYVNLASPAGDTVEVSGGKIQLNGLPVIVLVPGTV